MNAFSPICNRDEIEKLISDDGILRDYIDLQTQLTPNGFDITVEKVYKLSARGSLDFSNKERVLPETEECEPEKNDPKDRFGWWDLPAGVYKIRCNEYCSLPNNLIALAFTRSSLLRMGAFTHSAVWDAGFKGKSEFILSVQNPHGLRLKQNARVAQLVFFKINGTKHTYSGIFQDKD
jgi:dUTP pyrophosphatase